MIKVEKPVTLTGFSSYVFILFFYYSGKNELYNHP